MTHTLHCISLSLFFIMKTSGLLPSMYLGIKKLLTLLENISKQLGCSGIITLLLETRNCYLPISEQSCFFCSEYDYKNFQFVCLDSATSPLGRVLTLQRKRPRIVYFSGRSSTDLAFSKIWLTAGNFSHLNQK